MGGGREEVGKGKKAGRRERRVKKRVQGGREKKYGAKEHEP